MDDAARALYHDRGIGGLQKVGARPCLVVVDLSYGFTEPFSPLGCDAELALSSVAELLQAARDCDVLRVFTRIEYDDAALRTAQRFLEKMPGLAALRPGERMAAIDDRVAPQADEPVLTKLFASAFHGTPLASLLVAHGSDTVIVTGASTSGCVRATAVDALQHGYSVVVPRQGVADRAAGPHEAALFDIQAKYGEVVDTSVALEVIRASAGVAAGTGA